MYGEVTDTVLEKQCITAWVHESFYSLFVALDFTPIEGRTFIYMVVAYNYL